MTTMKILEYGAIALIPLFLLFDLAMRRARIYTTPRHWRVRAFAVTLAIFALSFAVAYLWGSLLGDAHLLEGAKLGTLGGAVVGLLVYELFHYWWHRAEHSVGFLWRWSHQMHHSAESVDAFGAYYLHPIDAVMFTTISSLVFFPLLGLTPMAGAIAALFLTFNAMFQHANIKTPHWLGYIIQRPESHVVHHAREIHRHNYADLPLWDMVFGTFHNPREVPREAGFYCGASSRIGEMLVGRDVSTPPAHEPRRQLTPPTDRQSASALPISRVITGA
ncbi:MAG: sterol desaturase family protein [Myxococcales bacterium]|nr:sterol desaturase family protein [Myxococcales bacterium]